MFRKNTRHLQQPLFSDIDQLRAGAEADGEFLGRDLLPGVLLPVG